MKTVKIDYLEFKLEQLEEIDDDKYDVFVNFYKVKHIFKKDLFLLEKIVEKFNDSKILFLNMCKDLKKELVFFINRFENIKVLLR